MEVAPVAIEVMVDVWKCEALTDQAETLIMLALADMANNDGVCWPSLETIAKRSRVTRSYVVRVLRSLKERGFIDWEKPVNKKSNHYVIVRAALVNSVHQNESSSELSTPGTVYSVHQDSVLSTPDPSLIPQVKPKVGAGAPDRPAWVDEYRAVFARYPKKNTWQLAADDLGEYDHDRFTAVCREWLLRGYNPGNVAGIVEVYRNGWQRSNGNGAQATTTAQAEQDVPAWKRDMVTIYKD